MTKDIRKEQLALLRVEKQIAGVAGALSVAAIAAKTADGKLHASDATQAYAEMQNALVHLAEVTSRAHDALNAQALDAGLRVLEATGGTPKRSLSAVVESIIGLG